MTTHSPIDSVNDDYAPVHRPCAPTRFTELTPNTNQRVQLNDLEMAKIATTSQNQKLMYIYNHQFAKNSEYLELKDEFAIPYFSGHCNMEEFIGWLQDIDDFVKYVLVSEFKQVNGLVII